MTARPERPDTLTPADGALAVRVRYFAGARAAAGVAEETVRVLRPGHGGQVSAGDVIDAVLALHPGQLARVVASCSFLLDGVAVRDRAVGVADGAELDVLPPFAGG
jgi:sulfur-carrier protein